MIYLLVLVAAASRFLPHPPNVACIGAMGLLAGCYLQGPRAYAVPLVALGISDVIGSLLNIPGMGFYSPMVMAAVYGGMMTAIPIGRLLANPAMTLPRWIAIPGASVMASTMFFLVSNAGVAMSGWYPISFAGVMQCYVAALPFYGLTLVGDLVFCTVMFTAMSVSTIAPGRWLALGRRSFDHPTDPATASLAA